MPFVRQLAARGFTPAGLVISHRHVAGTGDALGALANLSHREFLSRFGVWK